MEKQRVIVVGNDIPDFGEDADKYLVVGVEATVWSIYPTVCSAQLAYLVEQATEKQAAILLQSVPGALAGALIREARKTEGVHIGVIACQPTRREVTCAINIPTAVAERDNYSGYPNGNYVTFGSTVIAAIQAACPNAYAKVVGEDDKQHVEIINTPPMKYAFAFIEWLM